MAQFLSFFYLVTALVWIFRSRRALEALRENPEVRPAPPPKAGAPRVSILLPVKNEELNLSGCLQGLLRQDYPAAEIIVTNDHSVDRTAKILRDHTESHPDRVQGLESPPLPEGWTGKNWALAEGVRKAQGEWFLFTDADTRHNPWAVSSAVRHAEERDLDLLTLTPRCLVEGFWEKVVQPAAMGFLGLWFPFFRVNRPRSPLVFGNGQFFLIRRKVYEAIGGHERVKGELLEDFGLVREAKRAGFRIECAIGTQIYGTRMYRSFSAIWLGWRRIYLHAFRKNPWVLLRKAAPCFGFSFLPFFFFPLLTRLALLRPEPLGMLWGAAFPILALIGLTAWKTHRVVGAPSVYALLHPVAGLLLAGILTDAAWVAFRRKEVKWR